MDLKMEKKQHIINKQYVNTVLVPFNANAKFRLVMNIKCSSDSTFLYSVLTQQEA